MQINKERTKWNSGAGRSTKRKQREVFLVGDSILKNLQGRIMSSTAKVKNSSFPGCSTQDMRNQIRPIKIDNFADDSSLILGAKLTISSAHSRADVDERSEIQFCPGFSVRMEKPGRNCATGRYQ